MEIPSCWIKDTPSAVGKDPGKRQSVSEIDFIIIEDIHENGVRTMGPSFAISVFRICFPFRLPCRPHGNAPPSPEGDLGKELPGNFTPFSIPPDTLEKNTGGEFPNFTRKSAECMAQPSEFPCLGLSRGHVKIRRPSGVCQKKISRGKSGGRQKQRKKDFTCRLSELPEKKSSEAGRKTWHCSIRSEAPPCVQT